MAQVIREAYCYAKLQGDREHEEEKRHRRAQFLIYKTMEKADSLIGKRPLPLRMRVCRLKVKMGKKTRRLRSRLRFAVSFLKVDVYGQLTGNLKLLMRALHGREAIATLTPA